MRRYGYPSRTSSRGRARPRRDLPYRDGSRVGSFKLANGYVHCREMRAASFGVRVSSLPLKEVMLTLSRPSQLSKSTARWCSGLSLAST
jgi:hypothetical protein